MSFEYPEDWEITDDETQDSVRYIFVQGPKNSALIIQQHPLAEAPTLEEFSNIYSDETQVVPVNLDSEVAEASPSVVAQPEFMIINRDLGAYLTNGLSKEYRAVSVVLKPMIIVSIFVRFGEVCYLPD